MGSSKNVSSNDTISKLKAEPTKAIPKDKVSQAQHLTAPEAQPAEPFVASSLSAGPA